jgi:ferritin-like metal-binding protein YciE
VHRSEQKIVQYLNEAHATEVALIGELQAQIAMTPGGTYRTALERHLRETRDHARRVEERLRDLGQARNPLQLGLGLVESAIGQALAIGKAPLDMARGTGGEEKVLKNAKDACASEGLEIATYTALERLARSVGDSRTAALAAEIRADEEKMLDVVLREIPKLTEAVVDADVRGKGSYDVGRTGAAQAMRRVAGAVRQTAQETASRARRTSRKARAVPGVARAEGQVKGAMAGERDLPISRYDSLTADEVVRKLTALSQIDLAKVEAYERKHQARSTILNRIQALRGDEPWPGYDELTIAEIRAILAEAGAEQAENVREYERAHKNRASVVAAAERELASA